jgi:hypothetical protein
MERMSWLLAVSLLATNALACNKGCQPYSEGVCVCEPKTETYKFAPTPTSNEEAPKDKMPSYERPGIHAEIGTPATEPSSAVAHDYAAERNQK